MKRMTPTNMPQIELHMRWPKDWCETRASPAMDGPAPMVGEAPSLAVAANRSVQVSTMKNIWLKNICETVTESASRLKPCI